MTTEWSGLPDEIVAKLNAAGLTPDTVRNSRRRNIMQKASLGYATLRKIIRAGYIPADIRTPSPLGSAASLALPDELSEQLDEQNLLLLVDFSGIEGEPDMPGTDGCELVQRGLTVSQVRTIRVALEKVPTGFANRSRWRVLGDIPFDDELRALLQSSGINLAAPLRGSGIAVVMNLLAAKLGAEPAEAYRERITDAYWVGGYERL